ncbi:hypothetical protein [Rhizobium sp. SSA_523]|uniref:hypothetical protein n=1 Tax=Rhizobium sp. SSA_523 TaxID=2952477 RepID=UPI0020905651|nr:hypothetical protein [Rhizobium sp. SSA_523]MCO5734028.1 hypothetical protein [Rhizobium sp. SSA_523]WKC24669.1 hypothetical protein QTJ18_11575 [Rhizobium sp. SSA_523]
MNVWFTRLLFAAVAITLIGIILSIIPLNDQPRDAPEGVILSPDTPPPAKVAPPQGTN